MVGVPAERRLRSRVLRLSIVSVPGLGVIWLLSTTAGEGQGALSGMLAAAWVLMGPLLILRLRWPGLRYALAVPSVLAGLAVIGLSVAAIHGPAPALGGWLLVTGGILLGGLLGAWFWFRWLPVPAALEDPYSLGRWVLIAGHVLLILGGIAVLSLP